MKTQKKLLGKLCRCIKAVTRKVKKESVAIPICITSVLGSRGKTIHSFRCKKRKGKKTPFLKTQTK
jgi:hypothetical protein